MNEEYNNRLPLNAAAEERKVSDLASAPQANVVSMNEEASNVKRELSVKY